jgi:predicted transcriptional regulator
MKAGFLVRLKENPKIYRTTEKGCAFLDQYKKLQDMLSG